MTIHYKWEIMNGEKLMIDSAHGVTLSEYWEANGRRGGGGGPRNNNWI